MREGSVFRCPSGHSFDVARQGYVNLLPCRAHTGTADTPEMLDSRQAVLAGPHFGPLVERVSEAAAHAAGSHEGCILDVGAGTGEYLASALRRMPGRCGIALDISRHACRRSVRAHGAITSAVCDAWQQLPVADGVAAVVLSVFAPRNPEEFARVLAPGGAVVIVAPEPDHLGELVEALGLVTVDADKPARLQNKFGALFERVSEERYSQPVRLSVSEAAAIVGMGPSARHLQAGELEQRLAQLGEWIDTRISVTIQTWSKRTRSQDMSDGSTPSQRVAEDLDVLTEYPDRHVGGPGNRAATAYFAEVMASLGLEVSRSEMPCFEWLPGHAYLEMGGARFDLEVGPYSLPCDITAPLFAAGSVEELESEAMRGAIVLLHSEAAAGQYMPRNFTFYNPESHQRVYRAIDDFSPAAILGATGRDPEMVGSQYPFPLFEDGDLDVPNAFLTDVEGKSLTALAGGTARLVIASERRDSIAEHVVAALPGTGSGSGRIVVSAHIDSRRGSPGALDNASGVATMLEAARLLVGYEGSPSIEFVPFNGEDDYANPGELRWIEENAGRFDEIVLGINIDDSGQVGADNSVSFYGCPEEILSAVHEVMSEHPRLAEGPQWFQGDHSILGIYGRPAIAIASADMYRFMAQYAHTDRDVVALADPELIASTAAFVAALVSRLGEQ